MQKETLTIETRQVAGKGLAHKTRREGKLPGVLYGQGTNVNINVDPGVVHKFLLMEGGKNKVFTLVGAGLEGKRAMIKEYQIDPVSRQLLHVDLMEILATETIDVNVRLNFVGKPVGVTETGGVMSIIEREIEIACLPDQIPDHVDVDVSQLKIGDSIHLDEIALPEGVKKLSIRNPTLVTVVPPTKEEDLAPKLEEAAEPEVLTARKVEGEEEEGAEAAPPKAAKEEKKEEKKEDKKEKK